MRSLVAQEASVLKRDAVAALLRAEPGPHGAEPEALPVGQGAARRALPLLEKVHPQVNILEHPGRPGRKVGWVMGHPDPHGTGRGGSNTFTTKSHIQCIMRVLEVTGGELQGGL